MSSNPSETRRKISLFENSEKEKSEREEKDRKRAIFARKLSKGSVYEISYDDIIEQVVSHCDIELLLDQDPAYLD
jgi:hypothetical protein